MAEQSKENASLPNEQVDPLLLEFDKIKQITDVQLLREISGKLYENLKEEQTEKIKLKEQMFIFRNQFQTLLEHCDIIEDEIAKKTNEYLDLDKPFIEKYKEDDIKRVIDIMQYDRKMRGVNVQFENRKKENTKSFKHDMKNLVRIRDQEDRKLQRLITKQAKEMKILKDELKAEKKKRNETKKRVKMPKDHDKRQEYIKEINKLSDKFIHDPVVRKMFDDLLESMFKQHKKKTHNKNENSEHKETQKFEDNLNLYFEVQAMELKEADQVYYVKVKELFEEKKNEPNIQLEILLKTLKDIDELNEEIAVVEKNIFEWDQKLKQLGNDNVTIGNNSKKLKCSNENNKDLIATAEISLKNMNNCVRNAHYCSSSQEGHTNNRKSQVLEVQRTKKIILPRDRCYKLLQKEKSELLSCLKSKEYQVRSLLSFLEQLENYYCKTSTSTVME